MGSKDKSAAMKQNVRTLRAKFESNVNWAIEETNDHANAGIATVWETLNL